jgi:hypothetical protein
VSSRIAIEQPAPEVRELDVHDGADLRRAQRMEHADVVDAVDELGPEVLLHHFHDRGLHRGVVALAGELLDDVASQVRRHDDHGVAEVDGAALAIREAAVVEHLQQHVEHIGCAFSTSSSRITA